MKDTPQYAIFYVPDTAKLTMLVEDGKISIHDNGVVKFSRAHASKDILISRDADGFIVIEVKE